ncbi:MAG: hypothetical protein ACKO9D_07700 [Gammaproteobacteria bacterium]
MNWLPPGPARPDPAALDGFLERAGLAPPSVGQKLQAIDHDGRPVLLLRTTEVREVLFGRVTALDIAIDGSPVRDPAIWKPLHTRYWNALLQPFGLAVSDDMPFWAERFTLLFDADAGSVGVRSVGRSG